MASPGPLFTHDENVGLFVLTGMASLSATAIIGLLSYIVVSCTSPTLRMSIDDSSVFQSIAPCAYFQVQLEDGNLVAPLKFTSLTSWGGILLSLPASYGKMITKLSSNWDFFASGGLMDIKWGIDKVRIAVCRHFRVHISLSCHRL